MNINQLYGMVKESPETAQDFVSSLVNEILLKKVDSFRQSSDSRQYQDSGYRNGQIQNSNWSRRGEEITPFQRSLSLCQQPAKSPHSIQPLFKIPQQQLSRKIAITDIYQKNHQRRFQSEEWNVNLEYFQSPSQDLKGINITSRSRNKSPALCSFCRQTLNVSTSDNIEKSQIFDRSYKRKNLGYYNQNFFYLFAPQKTDIVKQQIFEDKMDKQLTKDKELNDNKDTLTSQDDLGCILQNLKTSKVLNFKHSDEIKIKCYSKYQGSDIVLQTQVDDGKMQKDQLKHQINCNMNLQSFDFDLTVSQAPKESQVIVPKELRLLESGHSQVIISQDFMPSHEQQLFEDQGVQVINQCTNQPKQEIQFSSQMFIQNEDQLIKESEISISNMTLDQDISISKIQDHSNQHLIDIQCSSFTSQDYKFIPIENYDQSILEETPLKLKEENMITLQMQRNLSQLSKFIVPNDEREKKSFQQSRSSIKRDFISEPIELINESLYKPSMVVQLKTPFTKNFDQLDMSDIQAKSHLSSPSMTLQFNQLNEYDQAGFHNRKNTMTNPQLLMSRVYDQIATLKTSNKMKENKFQSKPPNHRVSKKKVQSQQTVYQQVLKAKKK